MAKRQSLKGDQFKVYDVLSNFNGGIDKSTADDLANDHSFRQLTNFYNGKEGILTKRTGLYNTYLNEFLNDLDSGRVFGRTAVPKYEGAVGTIMQSFMTILNRTLSGVIQRKDYAPRDVYVDFKPASLIELKFYKNENFNKVLENYEIYKNDTAYDYKYNFPFKCDFLIAYSYELEAYSVMPHGEELPYELNCKNGYILSKLSIECDGQQGSPVTYQIDQVSSMDYLFKDSVNAAIYYSYNFDKDDEIEIASYNDFSYMLTKSDYILKIKDTFEEVTDVSYDEFYKTSVLVPSIFSIMGKPNNSNLYKPVPVEVSNIGFNLLATNPISYYENTGSTDAIKGIFYSVNKNGNSEPILNIPSNSAFNIHVIATGSTSLGTPQWRYDNGDTDTTSNPYKNLSGSYSGNIFKCNGIDYSGRIEIKITKGTAVTFIGYVSTGNSNIKETGLLDDTRKLIFSSTHLKVIGNQLVLYGGHGYMFFSEYDRFDYFPNYNFLYITTEAGEEEVTGIKYFRQYYAVFTKKRIKRMTGTFGTSNFGLYPLNDYVGCPNGNTIQQVNNNLLFLAIDGLYRLKQGYVGEGTENVEKIDLRLSDTLSSNNIKQAFVLGNYYIMMRNDKPILHIYDFEKNIFFDYYLESSKIPVMKTSVEPKPTQDFKYHNFTESYIDSFKGFKSMFQNTIFDEHGASIFIPDYDYKYNVLMTKYTYEGIEHADYNLQILPGKMKIRELRLTDLDFISESERNKDSIGYISEFETPNLNMGYPTNTKKFKEIYIKMSNESNEMIPLYITIYIDDVAYISPEDYEVVYDAETNTYYYIYKGDSNQTLLEGADILKAQEVLGTITLGEDVLGRKTISQLKIKINKKGRTIKVVLADGYDNKQREIVMPESDNTLVTYERARNVHEFSVLTMGIVYKVKKVKEG